MVGRVLGRMRKRLGAQLEGMHLAGSPAFPREDQGYPGPGDSAMGVV